jgi:tetratricopeptide (TPR) repeat protein
MASMFPASHRLKLIVHLLLIAGVGPGVFTAGRSSIAQAVEPAVAEAEATGASEATTEPAGQADLDAAIEQKLSARSLEDFERVVDLCRRALRKGLAKESEAFADSLLVGTLIDRAGMLVDAIFDGPKPNPEWPRMRTFAMRDLSEAVRRSPDLGTAHLMIARLQALPGGNQKAAVLAANKAIKLLAPGQAERLQLAEAYLVRGNLADDPVARKADYDKAVEIAPADADIRQTRGLFLLLQNDFGPAREDLQVAIEQNPEEAGLHEALGMAYMMDNGLEDEVRLEKARESFDRAIAIAPGAAGPLLQRARVLAMQGEQPEAIADLDKAVEMAPENAVPLVLRARIQQQAGNSEAAAADLAKVLAAQPDNPAALELRGLMAADAGNFAAAIRDFTTLANRSQQDPLVLGQLGMLHLAAKQPRAAIPWFGKALGLDDSQFLSRRGRSDALISIGKHAEALKDLEAALTLEPDDSGVLNNLAWLLATSPVDNLRDGKRAIELATKACEETEWKAAHIISTLAAAYAETGNFAKAREMSQKAVDIDGGTGGIDDQLNQELQSYRDEKPWRERQEMTEAELPGLGASNANAAAAETSDQQPPAAPEKPRRPFD